jgi:hypothetical protein
VGGRVLASTRTGLAGRDSDSSGVFLTCCRKSVELQRCRDLRGIKGNAWCRSWSAHIQSASLATMGGVTYGGVLQAQPRNGMLVWVMNGSQCRWRLQGRRTSMLLAKRERERQRACSKERCNAKNGVWCMVYVRMHLAGGRKAKRSSARRRPARRGRLEVEFQVVFGLSGSARIAGSSRLESWNRPSDYISDVRWMTSQEAPRRASRMTPSGGSVSLC